MRLFVTQLLAMLVAVGYSTRCKAGDIKEYLAEDGNLKEKVTLEIGEKCPNTENCPKYQVTVWVIEPSGAWTQETRYSTWLVAARSVVAKGHLTEPQRAALARHLAAQDFNGLPARVSAGPLLTPDQAVAIIGFGKKTAKLEPVPGKVADTTPAGDDQKASEWSRFVALNLVLEDIFRRSRVEAKKDTPR